MSVVTNISIQFGFIFQHHRRLARKGHFWIISTLFTIALRRPSCRRLGTSSFHYRDISLPTNDIEHDLIPSVNLAVNCISKRTCFTDLIKLYGNRL